MNVNIKFKKSRKVHAYGTDRRYTRCGLLIKGHKSSQTNMDRVNCLECRVIGNPDYAPREGRIEIEITDSQSIFV